MKSHFIDCINPMLLKELRSRMRGRKGFMSLVLFVSLQALVFLVIYGTKAGNLATGSSYVENRYAEIGRHVYQGFTALIMVLVTLFTPAMSATTLTVEKERKTLDFLRMTNLGPFRIVLGKLLASLCSIALLVTTSLPIMSLVFFFGGVTPLEIFRAYGYAMLLGLLLGSLGVWISASAKKGTSASTAAYGMAFLFFTTGFPGLLMILFGDRREAPLETIPFFDGRISVLLVVALATGVVSLALLQLAAAQLRDADSDESMGERSALALLVIVAAVLTQGVIHGIAPLRAGARSYTQILVVTASMGAVGLLPFVPLLCVRRPSRRDLESGMLGRFFGPFGPELLRARLSTAPFVTVFYYALWMGTLLVTAVLHGFGGVAMGEWLGAFCCVGAVFALAHLFAGLAFAAVSAAIPRTAGEHGSYLRGLVLVLLGFLLFSSNMLRDSAFFDPKVTPSTGLAGTILIAMSPINAVWSVFEPVGGFLDGYPRWVGRGRIPLWAMTLVLHGLFALLLWFAMSAALDRRREGPLLPSARPLCRGEDG